MDTKKENIKVEDRLGFVYYVVLEHKPHHGFSSAIYKDEIIAQVDMYRIREPFSDDDREWEAYDERLAEWTDEVKVNMDRLCKEYFNRKLDKK